MLTKSIFVLLVWLVHISSSYDKSDVLFGNRRFITRARRSERCTLPAFPEHGKWKLLRNNSDKKPGDPVLTSSVIIFECQPGYKVTTESNLSVCIGQWTLSPSPNCEKLCPPLYSSNTYQVKCINKLGREVSCAEATHGTSLEYECASFFEAPFGHKRTLFCENGNWDVQRPICRPVCGKKLQDNSHTLIFGSKPDEKIKYPWMTAVYERKKDGYEHICGGSILSETIVLTAAHCVTNEYGDALPAENYRVGAGKLYRKYNAPEDEHAQYLEVSKIVIPQGYRGQIRRYVADLAVLVMKGEFVVTQIVQPVCFTNMNSIRLRAGNKGTVSGWGLVEGNKPSNILRSLEIPYKYETLCADELPPDFADEYNLQDKICAGFVNKSISVCEGDSGGAFAFEYREDNRYYVHGVVSLAHKVNFSCDIQQNALYTKVASYYNFVEGLLTKYAPKVRDCVLPAFHKNGSWTVDISGINPGDVVPSSTILTLNCNEGFGLASATAEIECSSAYNMPTCEQLCPDLHFPKATFQFCADRYGQVVNCSSSIHLTELYYICPNGYIIPEGTSPKRTCVKGSWGTPPPECVRPNSDCGKIVDDVVDGTTLKGLENPWNVGIYKKIRDDYQYACTGSLVSDMLVVTSARCIIEQLKGVRPVFMAAGKVSINYLDLKDTGAQFSKVADIYINSITGPSYPLPDIAVLHASRPFHFNRFVQAICTVQLEGDHWETKVASHWKVQGEVENLKVQRGGGCWKYSKRKTFLPLLVEKECAVFEDNSTCLDPTDTGRGLVARHLEDNTHYLFGIVSTKPDKKTCETVWYTSLQEFHMHYIQYISKIVSAKTLLAAISSDRDITQ